MELKSLKLALKVLEVCLIRHNRNVCYYGNDEAYKEASEAKEDIEECVKVIDERIEKLEEMDTTDIMGTGWTFPIMIDAEYSLEYLAKKKNL